MELRFTVRRRMSKEEKIAFDSLTREEKVTIEDRHRRAKLPQYAKLFFDGFVFDPDGGAEGICWTPYDVWVVMRRMPVEKFDKLEARAKKVIEKIFPEDEEWY